MKLVVALPPRRAARSSSSFAAVSRRARRGRRRRSSTPGRTASREVVYAFTSAANNNGSAFGGLTGNTDWYNTTLGLAMLGRPVPADRARARDRRLAGAQAAGAGHRGHVPDRHAALRRPARRRRADRRRAHLLPRRSPSGRSSSSWGCERVRQPPLLLDRAILAPRAASTALRKLDPRRMARNPVMFVVEIGSVLVTILFATRRSPTPRTCSPGWSPPGSGSRCCSPTSPRRWPRAAARRRPTTLRKTPRRDDRAPPPAATARSRRCRAPSSPVGDEVVVSAGEVIPADGEVIEGIASVDESAITGESAPVIRESGGDRSAVTGGTRVLSDRIVVRVTARARRELPRPDDRARRGRRAAEDAERDRAQHPARRADDRSSCSPSSRCSRSRSTRAPSRT